MPCTGGWPSITASCSSCISPNTMFSMPPAPRQGRHGRCEEARRPHRPEAHTLRPHQRAEAARLHSEGRASARSPRSSVAAGPLLIAPSMMMPDERQLAPAISVHATTPLV
jgi:hypothetical protein